MQTKINLILAAFLGAAFYALFQICIQPYISSIQAKQDMKQEMKLDQTLLAYEALQSVLYDIKPMVYRYEKSWYSTNANTNAALYLDSVIKSHSLSSTQHKARDYFRACLSDPGNLIVPDSSKHLYETNYEHLAMNLIASMIVQGVQLEALLSSDTLVTVQDGVLIRLIGTDDKLSIECVSKYTGNGIGKTVDRAIVTANGTRIATKWYESYFTRVVEEWSEVHLSPASYHFVLNPYSSYPER